MIHRPAFAILGQVLLADIGDVARIPILGEQVIERLFAVRANFFRDRFVPFLAVGEDRVDIEHHSAKIEDPVAHHIADPEPGPGKPRRIDIAASLGREERGAIHAANIGPDLWRNNGKDRTVP